MPKSRVQTRVNEPLEDDIQEYAEEKSLSEADTVRELLRRGLSANEAPARGSSWLYLGLVATMTFLAAGWGGLMANGAYLLAALVGIPIPLSWYVLFKERDML